HQVKLEGRGKSGPEWFEVREANVSYDHPYDLPLEHALNIDFVNEALGPGARVAVELSVDAARQLVKTIQAALAQADQRGVLQDVGSPAAPAGSSKASRRTARAAWGEPLLRPAWHARPRGPGGRYRNGDATGDLSRLRRCAGADPPVGSLRRRRPRVHPGA